mgnify:FL=1
MDFAPGAWRLATVPFALSAVAAYLFLPAGVALLLFGAATLWFHRDPERASAGRVVSPADGTVSVVREEDDRVRVGVYMSPLSVHVNRAPLAGRIESVEHVPGAYRPAYSKDSDRNERLHIKGSGPDGEWDLVLIAGWFARRIHPYVERGAELSSGERVGHISYGSRADVVLPADVTRSELRVEEGDAVRAGDRLVERK